MKDPYGKGSIIYKLLIVILAGALAFSIVYPRKLSERESRNLELGRYRMSQLYNAEIQYQRFNNSFTDTLDKLLTFIETDSQYLHYVDSMVVQPIHKSLNNLDTLRQIQEIVDKLIPTARDSAIIDSIVTLEDRFTARSRDVRNFLEGVRERMVNFPALPVDVFDQGLEIIERKDYFLKAEVVRRMVKEVGELAIAVDASKEALSNVAEIQKHLNSTLERMEGTSARLDSIHYCPSVLRPFRVELQDSSVFRFVNIYCPINEEDIEKVESDFVLSTVGNFSLKSHGHIVKNEKSWAEEEE